MALDYVKTSKDIVEAVGGVDNISTATHCMTRLRLVLKDESKANDDKVTAIKGVKSVIKQGGQYQVVIGNEVSNLFKEFSKLGNFTEDASAGEVKKEGNAVQRLFGFIAGTMTPLLPAMLGTGMVKVLLTLFTTFGWMTDTSPTYIIFYGMADSFFYFLPIMLGWSIAKKMNASVPLFMVVGAMLVYPDVMSLLANGTELHPLGTFLGLPCTYIFGKIPVVQSTYSSSVLPMLLMAPIMKWAEDFADRVSPNVLKAFLKPMLFFLICTPIAFIVVGPLGNIIGNALAGAFSAAYNAVPWLTVAVLTGAMPFIVMTGMHYALIPLMMNNFATLGFDVIVLVTMFASNIAQGGAAFGVALRTKDTELKSEGIASGISATIAGVTEPAMYGINLRLGKPMVAAVIGATLSGLWNGITGVKGYTMGGSPSALSIIQFVDTTGTSANPMRGVWMGAIGGLIALIVPLVLTMFLYKDKKEEATAEGPATTEAVEAEEAVATAAVAGATTATATKVAVKPLVETMKVSSPMTGSVVELKDVPDQVFASGALGEGVAILPVGGNVYAPFDGEVTGTMESGHAIGLMSGDGVEVLIHVGLDTVALEGKPFQYYVKDGDTVKQGDLLMTADLAMIEKLGYKTYTPVIITNTDDYVSVKNAAGASVKPGDKLITIA